MTSLTPQEAGRLYDRIGRLQDLQPYERAALDDLVAHGAFDRAAAVVELGCGTGALAARLLARELPQDARYLGLDLSPRMLELAGARLARFGARAEVRRADGSCTLPVGDGGCDRVVSTYVLDLLAPEAARAFVGDARRALRAGGLLCLVSLAAEGRVAAVWEHLWRARPALVGGCRPIRLEPLVGDGWRVEHRRVVKQFGVASEVLVACPD